MNTENPYLKVMTELHRIRCLDKREHDKFWKEYLEFVNQIRGD